MQSIQLNLAYYVYITMYSYFSQKLFLSEVSKTLVSAEGNELFIGIRIQI